MGGQAKREALERILKQEWHYKGASYGIPVPLHNEYEIIPGRFGMSYIYSVENLEHQRECIIKFPDVNRDGTDWPEDALRNEIRVFNDYSHPNLVYVYETGEVEGLPYILMERLAKTLEPIYSYNKESIGKILDYMISVTEFAHDFHKKGYVHNDFKPDNLCLDQGGNVKVVDLGISGKGGYPDYNENGVVLGTVDFIAPEVLTSVKFLEPTPRSDVYSLGVTLYKLLSRSTPYVPPNQGITGYTTEQFILSLICGVVYSPILYVSDSVNSVLKKAVMIKPKRRYRSAKHFQRAILRLREHDALLPGEEPSKNDGFFRRFFFFGK